MDMLKLTVVLLVSFLAVISCASTHGKDEDGNEPSDPRHLTSNAAYFLSSYLYPEYGFGFNYDGLEVFLTWKRRRFTIQIPGVNRQLGTISLKSTDRADFYISYDKSYGRMLLQSRDQRGDKTIEEFENNATFVVRDNLFHAGYASFEIFTQEGWFISLSDCKDAANCLILEDVLGSMDPTIGDRISFRRKEGPYVIESLDLPGHFMGIDGFLKGALDRDAHYWYLLHPSLSQVDGTISLESAYHVQSYLRHNFSDSMELVQCHPNSCDKDSDIAQAASFLIKKEKYFEGYFALETGDARCIRHNEFSLTVERIDGNDEAAKESASWRAFQGPYYLEPVGYSGWGLTWREGRNETFLDRKSTRFVFIYPGLTGEGGTISIQLADAKYRDKYLRFDLDTGTLILDDEEPANPYYKEDATWWQQKDRFAANTLSFESYRRRQHYIIMSGNQIRVTNEYIKENAAFNQVAIF